MARVLTVVPVGVCLRCLHHADDHTLDGAGCGGGSKPCACPGLKLCAACEGDPEAHGRHICGRFDGD